MITGKIGQTYTASTYVKLESGGRTQAYVGIGQDGNGTELGAVYKVFDISGGTLVSGTKTTGSSQPTAGSATITAVGADGWYRITFSATLLQEIRFVSTWELRMVAKSAMRVIIPQPCSSGDLSLKKGQQRQLLPERVYRTR